MLPQLEQLQKDYEIIFICKFGSHLYGTNTPSSDTDYKGIYIPSFDDCIQGTIRKSIKLDTNKSNEKNTSEDIDCEIYSVQHFLQLALKGETVAIDMLHCNEECTVFKTHKWTYIQSKRRNFYSKNMKAFVGYAQKQAAKYGLKGSRIASAKKLLNYLNTASDLDARISSMWDTLPTDEHMRFVHSEENSIPAFNFCGKQIQSTVKISYAINMIEIFLKQYGQRAQQAEQNEGVDWKAISHALRAAYQLIEIYKTNNLVFPLTKAEYLKQVKAGSLDFKTVITELESQITLTQQLADESSFPKDVNPKYIKTILKRLYRSYYDPRL